jgi:iron complex outermembrane receptor protein
MNSALRVATACALILLPGVALAEEGRPIDAATGEDAFDLGQIVVQASAPKDAMVGDSSIGHAAIEAFDRNTLDDAASLIPGVSASNSGGARNERLLYVRGFDRFQVPLSIDGIRVYLPADNRLDYGRFLTQDIAEIQVAKGYVSVLDGPGAMGGAVNLVTMKPTRKLEAEARTTLDLDRSGDYAGYTAFTLLGTKQDAWYAQASFARNFTDHWDLPGGFVSTASEGGGERDFSRSEDWRLNAKIGFTPNATDEYSLSYTRQEGSKNAPLSTVDPANIQRNWTWPWWNIDSIYFLSRTAIGPSATLKTRLYRNGFDNLLSAYDDASQTTQTKRRAFNSYYEDVAWGGSAQLDIAASAADSLGLALHFRRDQHVEFQQSFPSGDTEPPQHNEEDTWSLAAENGLALSVNVSFTAGVSYDWRNLRRAEEYGTPPGGGPDQIFSYPIKDSDAWNAQARLEYRSGGDMRLYASVSSRARFPTIFERFSSRFGGAVSNPDLKVERATNLEIGGETRSGAFRVSGAVFYSHLTDVIVAFPFIYQGQAVTQSRNLGSGNYYGVEISVDGQIRPGLTVGVNYTWVHRDLRDPTNSAFEPTGVPDSKAFFYADWRPVPRLRILPSFDVASDRWTVNTAGTAYFRTGSYAQANLTAEYDVTERLTLGAGVKNAFDELYVLTDGFPEPGRRFFLTASWKN